MTVESLAREDKCNYVNVAVVVVVAVIIALVVVNSEPPLLENAKSEEMNKAR